MENNIIMLEDEHGCMIEFETIDVFEFEGVTYFALLEVLPEGQENDEVLIMQVEGDVESEEAELVMRKWQTKNNIGKTIEVMSK